MARLIPQSNHGHSYLTLRVPSIAEIVLLSISISEDIITGEIDNEDYGGPDRTKFNVLERQVPGLQGVHERYPSKIPDGEHEAETIRRDVHCSKDSRLEYH